MFHENLRCARENLNLSQKEFAERLCIPVSTYRNYENTLREPSYEILIEISKFLGVSTDELLGISKESDPKYNKLFFKIKSLHDSKFQILKIFVDFLDTLK